MKNDLALAIELEVIKDPQGFVIVEHVRDEAWLNFQHLHSRANFNYSKQVACLHFEGVWHLSSSRFKKLKSYPNIQPTASTSYYLHIKNSTLLQTLRDQRSSIQSDWQQYDRREYKHWVVESHDFYTNIIASRVEFSLLEEDASKHYFNIWNKI